MKVLYIGGTGNISAASSRLAVEQGIDLYHLNRGNVKANVPSAIKTIKADINNRDEVLAALGDHKFDVVVNWIAFAPEDIRRDIDIFRNITTQYIFISSASVYQKVGGHPVITESTPLYNPYWDYSQDKIACEELLNSEYRKTGFPITIVRPSLTYETVIPVAIGSWTDYTIVDRMKKGKEVIIHGDGSSLWSVTHAEDFALGFNGLLGNAQSVGHSFHITNDELLTWNQIYEAIASAANVELNPVHISSDFICDVADTIDWGWMRGNLHGDKAVSTIFDNSKIKRFVPGFQATIPFEKGIQTTLEWFEADPSRMHIDDGNNKFIDTVLKAYKGEKHRVIILTDIEADPDDTQSLVRLLLYANEIDIKGLVATTSCWLKNEVNPASIRKVIRAYEQVHPNLQLHDPEFPAAASLQALVKSGIPKYGMEGVGDGMDTEGSELIITELEKEDQRPLWISTWGGVNTLAQALHKLEQTRSERELKHLISKLRVYTISDQDDAGIWLRNTFPELFYIVSPGDHYGSATWNAIKLVVKGIDNLTISNGWLAENIQQGHGPLGICYPDVAWGMEGDTPAFLNLILNGLSNPEHPEWGGWGGRYELYKPEFDASKKGISEVPNEPETRPIWTNAVDKYSPYLASEYGWAVKPSSETFNDNTVTLWRWRDDFQNDFAARMDWCNRPYEEGNHAPEVVLSHPDKIRIKSGEGFGFDAFDTSDPDGDSFSFLWYVYPEATGYKGASVMGGALNAHGT